MKLTKMIKKGICTVLVMTFMIGIVGVCSSSSKVFAAGTSRNWSLSLPHDNGNYYFPFRKKQTNQRDGYVEVTKMESSGVAVWFNKGTSLKNVVKITDVVKFNKKTKKTVYYKNNYSKGTSVDMGIENSDNTWLFKDSAAGKLNYK